MREDSIPYQIGETVRLVEDTTIIPHHIGGAYTLEADHELLIHSSPYSHSECRGPVYLVRIPNSQRGVFEVCADEIYSDSDDDMSCDQCYAVMINGLYCHETGCPNTHKVKIEGQWVHPDTDEDSDWS